MDCRNLPDPGPAILTSFLFNTLPEAQLRPKLPTSLPPYLPTYLPTFLPKRAALHPAR